MKPLVSAVLLAKAVAPSKCGYSLQVTGPKKKPRKCELEEATVHKPSQSRPAEVGKYWNMVLPPWIHGLATAGPRKAHGRHHLDSAVHQLAKLELVMLALSALICADESIDITAGLISWLQAELVSCSSTSFECEVNCGSRSTWATGRRLAPTWGSCLVLATEPGGEGGGNCFDW